MSLYHFENGNSPIDEMVIRHTDGGGTRAYLHARADANTAVLDNLKKALTQRHMQWTPIVDSDKPMLEVRGFGKDEEKQLLPILIAAGASGPRRKDPTPDDKLSFKDKLKKNTLKASGYSYFLGDMGFIAYGWKESLREATKSAKYLDLLGGIFYAAGSPFIAFFGRGDKSDIQFRHLSYNMLRDFEKNGVDVPHDASIRAVANGHNSTPWKKVVTFCHRYPAEITNSIFAMAGAMIFSKGAIKYKEYLAKGVKDGKTGTPLLMDMGLGAMTMLAGLISVAVEEEPRKPEEPRKTGLAGAWQFVKEKPLRAAGVALGISTISHAGSTYLAYKGAVKTLADPSAHTLDELKEAANKKSALPFRALFVGANLTAEGLMAISSKGHGAGVISDISLDKSAYAVGADLVSRTPPEQREAMLDRVATFLSAKEHLGGEKKDIVKGIREQLASISENPWSGAIAKQRAQGNIPAPKESTHWQGRVASSQLEPAASHAI